jgi:hypothetical protein
MCWDNEVSNTEINGGFFCVHFSVLFAVFHERFNLSFSLYSTELCSVIGYYNPQSHKAVTFGRQSIALCLHIHALMRVSRQDSNGFDTTPHRHNAGYSKVIYFLFLKIPYTAFYPI